MATKPDISSLDTLKGALITTRSITYVEQGATASILRSIFAKLGLTELMNAKTVYSDSAAHAVAEKKAELGLHADQRDPQCPWRDVRRSPAARGAGLHDVRGRRERQQRGRRRCAPVHRVHQRPASGGCDQTERHGDHSTGSPAADSGVAVDAGATRSGRGLQGRRAAPRSADRSIRCFAARS